MAYGRGGYTPNELRRLLESLGPDEQIPSNELAQIYQPQQGGFVRREDTGQTLFVNGRPGGISDEPIGPNDMGQGIGTMQPPQQQTQRIKVAGYGNGIMSDVGEMEGPAPTPDFARGPVDTPKGRGFYGKDGAVYVKGQDGALTKVLLGYDRDASYVSARRAWEQKKAAADVAQSEASTEHMRAVTDDMRQPKRAAPTFHPEMGWVYPPDENNPTGRVLAPAGADGKPAPLKDSKIPQFAVEGVIQNTKAIRSIDSALQSLDTPEGKDATGWKGYLPNKILNEYVDPAGVKTRADIADVGSLQIKNRSGATVTVAEEPRLLPFIPLPTDDRDTVKKKMTRLREMIDSENKSLVEFYPGVKKHLDALSAPAGGSDSMPNPAENKGKIMRDSTTGQRYRSNGSKWETL